ncbi:MAG: selenoprotein O, partial [Sphingomicrobium sp.]
RALISALLAALRTRSVTIDHLFFDWRGGRIPSGYEAEQFTSLRQRLEGRTAVPGALDHAYWGDSAPCSMHIEEVEAIWAAIAERNDWGPFNVKVGAIRRMGEALAVHTA